MHNLANSIKFITAFPKNTKKWKYYLNNNFQNSYILKTDQFNIFILELVNNSINFDLKKYLKTFQSFFIDVLAQKIIPIKINIKEINKKFIENYWKKENNIHLSFKKYLSQQQQTAKSEYGIPNATANDFLIKKLFQL